MKTENKKSSKTILFFLTALCCAGVLAILSNFIAEFIPYHLISAGVFAMLLGMALNPLIQKFLDKKCSENSRNDYAKGLAFVSKTVLKAGIVLMGFTLSFAQVLHVGKFSLIVMSFTLVAAFGFGNFFGKIFKMNWKLSNLISAGTGICGGSAIAAIAPVIDAEDSDVAYAISATFIFDILMVIAFPIMGRYFNMTDLGYGLWTGTAVNDTSSVVAAGYAFSEEAGNFATIVKLTRTLSIVPIVLLFGYINQKTIIAAQKKSGTISSETKKVKFSISKIFPWFILAFLGFVAVRSIADVFFSKMGDEQTVKIIASYISKISKFAFVMALGSIGLKTPFTKVAKSGVKPMIHGFIISLIVVVVSFCVQAMLGQM